VYGQPNIMNPNVTNSLNIQNIPVKKVHVGDIDIAYKTFGKGNPILLIAGAGMTMGNWPPSVLNQLALNHTVVIFDNRGVGNTTAGTKPFLIQQFTNDTIDLLGALKIQKADVLGFSLGSLIAQELAVTHPEKVNRLLGASCGEKKGVPESPQLVRFFCEIVNKSYSYRERAKCKNSLIYSGGMIFDGISSLFSRIYSRSQRFVCWYSSIIAAFLPVNYSCPLLGVPILLATKLFGFLWFVETYVKGYILKLLLLKVHIKPVGNTVEGVKFIFTRWRDSVGVVE
jgi:pimeloyl-ACP methyl ester carboxylesterase